MTDPSRNQLQRRLGGIAGHVPAEWPVNFAGIRISTLENRRREFDSLGGDHHDVEDALLQTVASRLQGLEAEPNGAARAGGFSLHAGVDIASHQREKLERLCRYVSRSPVASERLALRASDPWRSYGRRANWALRISSSPENDSAPRWGSSVN